MTGVAQATPTGEDARHSIESTLIKMRSFGPRCQCKIRFDRPVVCGKVTLQRQMTKGHPHPD